MHPLFSTLGSLADAPPDAAADAHYEMDMLDTPQEHLTMPLESSVGGAPVLTSVRIPLVLPVPPVESATDPHTDLPAHLRRCGLYDDADEFERTRVTCDFALCAFLLMHSHAGVHADTLISAHAVSEAGEQLMMSIESVLRQREHYILEQMERFAASAGVPLRPDTLVLPPEIQLDWLSESQLYHALHTREPAHPLSASLASRSALPTHLLALCSAGAQAAPGVPSAALGRPAHVVDQGSSVLVPVHWLVYVLQCAHMPHYVQPSMVMQPVPRDAASAATLACGTGVPIVVLSVAYPQYWSIIHRWLYTQDTGKLMASLLPLDYVLQTLRMQSGPSQLSPMTQEAAVDALARLGFAPLLQLVLRIRATWHNARRIGIYAQAFWKTLGDAWVLVVAAVAARKNAAGDAQPHSA